MFQLAETKALAVGGVDAKVRSIVELVDALIPHDVRRRGINENQVADRHLVETYACSLALEDRRNVVVRTGLRIDVRREDEIGVRVALEDAGKPSEGEIQALALAVPVRVEEHDRVCGNPERLAEHQTGVIRQRTEGG